MMRINMQTNMEIIIFGDCFQSCFANFYYLSSLMSSKNIHIVQMQVYCLQRAKNTPNTFMRKVAIKIFKDQIMCFLGHYQALPNSQQLRWWDTHEKSNINFCFYFHNITTFIYCSKTPVSNIKQQTQVVLKTSQHNILFQYL